MKNPDLNYKAFAKERKEHPSFTDKQVKQIIKDHAKADSVYSVASSDVSPKQKYTFHMKEVFKELKKDSPDWNAIKYHRAECEKYRRLM